MRRSVECPKCGAVVGPPGDKPYCPSCGWNQEKAEKYLRREIRGGSAILVLIGVVALVSYIFNYPAIDFVALLSVGILIFGGGLIVWKQRAINRLRAPLPNSDRPLARAPFSRPTSFPKKYEFLRSLRPPRELRSRESIKSVLAKHLWGANQRRLLTEGEITFGWVIDQENKSQNEYGAQYSEITYEFRDSSGFLIRGRATDETKSFYEEMIIPVFYEKGNPRNNTVLTDLDDIVKPGDE